MNHPVGWLNNPAVLGPVDPGITAVSGRSTASACKASPSAGSRSSGPRSESGARRQRTRRESGVRDRGPVGQQAQCGEVPVPPEVSPDRNADLLPEAFPSRETPLADGLAVWSRIGAGPTASAITAAAAASWSGLVLGVTGHGRSPGRCVSMKPADCFRPRPAGSPTPQSQDRGQPPPFAAPHRG